MVEVSYGEHGSRLHLSEDGIVSVIRAVSGQKERISFCLFTELTDLSRAIIKLRTTAMEAGADVS